MKPVQWPIHTLRTEKGDLFVSVDSLRGLRNTLGEAGWPEPILFVIDGIIIEAQKADFYGKEVT